MKIGIIANNQAFLSEVLATLRQRHQVQIYSGLPSGFPMPARLKAISSLKTIVEGCYSSFLIPHILNWSDATFFDFATIYLVRATHRPKVCRIVTRLHRYELFQDYLTHIDWKKVDKIIFVSKHTRHTFLSKIEFDTSKTLINPTGVDTERFRPRNRAYPSKRIGMLGDIIPRKRVYEMILAFSVLHKEIPDLTLSIAGAGIDQEYLYHVKSLLSRLRLHDSVFFGGRINNIETWYNSIDILVSNSIHEGMQRSLIEAMASGCYPLGHHYNGIEEVLADNQIYYTEAEFVRKVKQYYSLDSERMIDMSLRTRNKVIKDFNIKNEINGIIESIEVKS